VPNYSAFRNWNPAEMVTNALTTLSARMALAHLNPDTAKEVLSASQERP